MRSPVVELAAAAAWAGRTLRVTAIAEGLLTLGCGAVVGQNQERGSNQRLHNEGSRFIASRAPMLAVAPAGPSDTRTQSMRPSLQLAGNVKTGASSHPLHRGSTRSNRIFVDGTAPVHLRGVYGVPRPHQLRHCFRHKRGGSSAHRDRHSLCHDFGRHDREHSVQPHAPCQRDLAGMSYLLRDRCQKNEAATSAATEANTRAARSQ